jgi:thiosulfate/3-mercaptopyruvate sulfurtransferase
VRTVFADCRFDLDDPPAARRRYLEGHIPGAVFLDLDADLSDKAVQGHGRHPLPGPELFAATMTRNGIGPGVLVVAYDDGTLSGASRLWWTLRHYGHTDVAVLHGGLSAWRGGPLARGEEPAPEPPPAPFVARPRTGDTITADEIAARLDDPGLLLLDARAPARWRGEVEPRDPRKGRIPGALNTPYADPAIPEAALAAALDPSVEVACYCGSGVSACVTLLRLHEAGRDEGRLYVGSWSDWSQRPELPIQTGL